MGKIRTRIRIGDRVHTPYISHLHNMTGVGVVVGRDYKHHNWIVRHVDYGGNPTYIPYKAKQLKRFPEYPIGYK